ncbi:MAG: dihydroorotate dehydrogenase [Candidatus Diapherotrites archaeon]|nr:dihydroorotate dehydrogenase [Candidatus Diapherotrites archaeon]
MLETKLWKLTLSSPLILASGVVWDRIPQALQCAKAGAGAIIPKTIMDKPRAGHPQPNLVRLETGLLNAIGLPSPGYLNMGTKWAEMEEIKKFSHLFYSIGSDESTGFKKVAMEVVKHKPSAIEVDISCPNVEGGGAQFSAYADQSAQIIREIKSVSEGIPVIAKLTPATCSVTEIGLACEKAGADALTATNSMPGMAINAEEHAPVLSFKSGGYTGAGLKPISLKCVYDLYSHVKIPILASGGAMNGLDCIEFLQAGASAVQLGTLIIQKGPTAFTSVNAEITEWMKAHRYKKISELVGIAHE